MCSLQEEFQQWRAAKGDAGALVEPLRTADGGGLVLGFLRPGGGPRVATVCLSPMDGTSFFAEGLEDPPDEVEEWLTEVNNSLSERARTSLAQTLDALLSMLPKGLGSGGKAVGSTAGVRGDGDEGMGSEEEDDDQDMLIADIQAGEERSAQREKIAEEERWHSMVTESASQGSRQASQVLMREMRNLLKLQGEGATKALQIEMVNDSLYRWCVQMHADGFPECPLKADLIRFGQLHSSGQPAVVMDVHFPDSYPMDPPFIRVVRPRFAMHTGHITVGGSVCMQLLTPSGWLPSVSLENVFVSIRSEMIEGGGRLDRSQTEKDYTVAEAQEAFRRVADRYGWLKK